MKYLSSRPGLSTFWAVGLCTPCSPQTPGLHTAQVAHHGDSLPVFLHYHAGSLFPVPHCVQASSTGRACNQALRPRLQTEHGQHKPFPGPLLTTAGALRVEQEAEVGRERRGAQTPASCHSSRGNGRSDGQAGTCEPPVGQAWFRPVCIMLLVRVRIRWTRVGWLGYRKNMDGKRQDVQEQEVEAEVMKWQVSSRTEAEGVSVTVSSCRQLTDASWVGYGALRKFLIQAPY